MNPRIVEWFERYLVSGEVIIHEDAEDTGISHLSRPVVAADASGGAA